METLPIVVFIIENVKNLAEQHKDVLNQVFRIIKSAGYMVEWMTATYSTAFIYTKER